MNVRTLATIACAVLAIACSDDDPSGRGEPTGTVGAGGGDNSGGTGDGGVGDKPGSGGSGAGPPMGFGGVFHHDQVDATNLSIEDHHVFRWSIFGCDFCSGDAGTWSVAGDELILSPARGERTMDWVNGVSFKVDVAEIRLQATADGLVATGMDGSVPFEQLWPAGRVCADCRGQLGPTGVVPCEGPLPPEPCKPGP
jgi:hypothetical protein